MDTERTKRLHRRRVRWSSIPARPSKIRVFRQATPSIIFGVILIFFWSFLTFYHVVSKLVLPNPVEVIKRVIADTQEGMIWTYLLPTVIESLLGSLIAIVVALPIGYLIAHSRLLSRILEPYIALTQAIPLIAVAPLLVIWVGYGTFSIAVLCAIIAFFPMITTATLGFRQIDPHFIEAASLDGASGYLRLRHVELPLAAPALLAGIRAGVVLSVTGAIVGEFVMGGQGLGTLLTLNRDMADSTGLFAILCWICIVALSLNAVVAEIEKRVNNYLSIGENDENN